MGPGMAGSLNEVHECVDELLAASWKDLPSAVLCHILTIVPYKRVDVKAVCSSWRQAINSSINSVHIPAMDLRLLRHLPNIKHLTVHGSAPRQHKQPDQSNNGCDQGPATHLHANVGAWPPSAASHVAASSRCSSSSSHCLTGGQQQHQQHEHRDQQPDKLWPDAVPRLLSGLVTLRLLHCPQAVLQLALSLSQAAAEGSVHAPAAGALASVKVLELCGAGHIDRLLLVLLALQQQQQQRALGMQAPVEHYHSSSLDSDSVALQKLEELSISSCTALGSASSQLGVLLQQLPALHVLQLSGCAELSAVPPAVCKCTKVTRLVLSHNELITHLPLEISRLTALQDLDLSGCCMLRSLGQGFSRLTSLTALNLSGSSGLWLDYSAAQHAHTAAAAASSQLPAASSSSSGSAAAARAALPQLLLPPLPHQQQHHLLPELARLARLHTLDMSNNRQLMVVPGCVSVLAGLAVLDVCGCGVRWLGDAVLDCGGLQQLLLRDNVLAELPEDISRLTNLKVLDVGACCSLWSLPRSLLQMSTLAQLTVPSKAIGQHIIEQLELRGSNPVEVVMEPGDLEDEGAGAAFDECLSIGSSSEDDW